MRIQPIPPEKLAPDIRPVHDGIASLIGSSQGPVKMIDDNGALLGPFAPMLTYPQFGVEALSFLRTIDVHATLPERLREVAILTVGGVYNSRFQLYAHEIMAKSFGIPHSVIASLAAGGHPYGLNEHEAIAHTIAYTLATGHFITDPTYKHAVQLLGKEGVAELIFLISGYCLISVVLNGFDVPSPDNN